MLRRTSHLVRKQHASLRLTELKPDYEDAWKNLTHAQERITAALPLMKPDDQLFAIIPFYAWLINPAQGYEKVLTALNGMQPTVKFTQDFSMMAPALDRLDAKTQEAARQFIAFFEGKIDLPTLKAHLEGR